jgi:enamine deaminase RidA (YjgF/YER057c/UK114 family)
MDVLAVSKGPGDACPFTRLFNPLQSEATDYGSAFARGVCVDVPDVRYVLISGTAAIDENGKSVHPDDPVGQIRRTIANFETILKAGGATPADLYHTVWYCKDPSHARIVREETRRRGWPEFLCPIVRADICRHDLLVEIDGSAAIPTA